MTADSKELGSRIARSNRFCRMLLVMRIHSPGPVGRGSLQRWSMNGADRNTPATQGRTSSVISASGNRARTAFIAGIARTASPTQFGPRIRIFLKDMSEAGCGMLAETRDHRGGCTAERCREGSQGVEQA